MFLPLPPLPDGLLYGVLRMVGAPAHGDDLMVVVVVVVVEDDMVGWMLLLLLLLLLRRGWVVEVVLKIVASKSGLFLLGWMAKLLPSQQKKIMRRTNRPTNRRSVSWRRPQTARETASRWW